MAANRDKRTILPLDATGFAECIFFMVPIGIADQFYQCYCPQQKCEIQKHPVPAPFDKRTLSAMLSSSSSSPTCFEDSVQFLVEPGPILMHDIHPMQTLNVGASRTDEEYKAAEESRRVELRSDVQTYGMYFFIAAGLAGLGTGLLPHPPVWLG
jgi:hypothetical protein